ncbi:hypothetical protein BD408DRAFT_133104 [Parasitella parasitica]|nr:hypothetical protein BD408DRAFT_133104 [Parasitella parasitica]
MVRSSVLFFSLICTGHVALGNYIPRYLDKYSSSSSSYPMKASASASTSVATRQSSIIGTEQPLLLNLTDSVIMQVVNHGPNDSKIIIYDHDIQIGETSLDLYPLNITLSGAHNTTRMNMKLLSLDSGEHVLNLIPQLKNGSHLLAQVNAEVRLLPRRQSSLLKRWSSNQDPSQNINETDYNAVVEWSIDTGDSINLDKYSSEEKEGNDGQDDDDDDDDDEDDDGDEDDEDDEDNDEDDDNYSEENEDDEDDEERSWKWNNKAAIAQ